MQVTASPVHTQQRAIADNNDRLNTQYELINPVGLDDRTYSATMMLEKRRETFEVEQALEAQKAEYARKLTEFKRKEEELHAKDQELQESLVRFNKFLHDNDHKCVRAQRKIEEEREQVAQKSQEIDDLKQQLAELKLASAELQNGLARLSIHTEYLESVIDHDDEFTEIKDILTRHDTLVATNNDLRQRSASVQKSIEETRAELADLEKARAADVLNLNNRLSVLQQEYEERERAASNAQGFRDAAVELRISRAGQSGALLMAAENIFGRTLATSHVLQKPPTMPSTQLDLFRLHLSTAVNHIQDLEHVLAEHGDG
ncbi:protein of unknown function (DUF4200) [Carpediemonas membranifera]|uniref:DUF4200 domain-containing protein n=1 Tax=Carpediemonas membranifera TaxID=201153 RepID=A0A8J6BBG8_9EUKA|nr:protein of unknown function (DUF4200) [Carpediemonas membranifera]|eukprot:KAG9397274.1 protein of unknown function (DUF4200) [Carpediemonas membranifera]